MRDNLLDSTFVVIDVEATGFDVERADIIDIAAVRVEGGIITEKFSTLVYPGYFIPERIKELTGITNAMLVGQPTIKSVLPEFLEFVGDNIVVGHFVEQDIKFINKYTKLYYNRKFKNPSLCTLKLSRKLFPNLEKYSLKSIADTLGLETNGVHRALKDATLTAEIFLRILEELWNKYGIGDYYALKRLEKGRF
ncbi:MAG: DNA polymerase III subunit epsilon [Aquifex sp.]|nr:MAG: DNA polymerase III subunit epsilon [Aquifex sp.]